LKQESIYTNYFTGQSGKKLSILVITAALIVITLSVYMQVGNHPFQIIDDGDYITDNPHVELGITSNNIAWAFTSIHSSNWHPITWLSHMADAQLYGMNPRGHHLTSVAIHTFNTLLLFYLLFRLTHAFWQSFFVAVLFSIHPLHVESVAWVAERKDVLSMFFMLITLLFYSEYVMKQKNMHYFVSLFFFILGLMAKPMLVTLPIVMLLLDIWPLERYRHNGIQSVHQISSTVIALIKEKIPFIFFALLSCFITIYAQHKGGSVASLANIPFHLRIENALVAYIKYIGKTLWPHDLAILYPFPSTIPIWQSTISLSILFLLSAAAIWSVRSYPYVAVGLFWFIITLVPVIGLVQVGAQSMADRYTYLPLIGIFIIIAWGGSDISKGMRHRQGILGMLTVTITFVLVAITWHQLGYWRDNISLYRHAIKITTGNNSLIHSSLADALMLRGKENIDEAILEYREALRLNPYNWLAHCNLGIALIDKGNIDEAILEYKEALRIVPNNVSVHYYLGRAFNDKGNFDDAIQQYQKALQINPSHVKSYNSLGVAYSNKGMLDEAIQKYYEALKVDPNYVDAHYNLALDLTNRGRLDAAIYEFREALRINPNDVKARKKLEEAITGR
jgi:protein O-mannosyl-transferase